MKYFGFKRVFGSNDPIVKRAIIRLLSETTGFDIDTCDVVPPELLPEFRKSKVQAIDIILKLRTGESILFEMQLSGRYNYFYERTIN